METYTGFEWLLIDLANQFGMDDKEYSIRLAWAKENLDYLETMTDQAESPATFIAATIAVRDAQAGIASGYMCELDAVGSGPQLLSVMTRCEVGMRNTGVINTGKRPDLYKALTDMMDTFEYARKDVKAALMPYFYGSVRLPEVVFGDDIDLFLATTEKVAPGACMARSILINAWQPFVEFHEWLLPDHHTAHIQVKQTVDTNIQVGLLDNRSFTFRHSIVKGKEYAVALAARVTHSVDAFVVREVGRRCNYDTNRLQYVKDLIEFFCEDLTVTDRTSLVSLVEVDNIEPENIHEYDMNVLARVHELIEIALDHSSFETCFIHDAFKCLPNHVQSMREAYNRVVYDIYNSNLLMDIIFAITGKRYDNFQHDEAVALQILENDYAIN